MERCGDGTLLAHLISPSGLPSIGQLGEGAHLRQSTTLHVARRSLLEPTNLGGVSGGGAHTYGGGRKPGRCGNHVRACESCSFSKWYHPLPWCLASLLTGPPAGLAMEQGRTSAWVLGTRTGPAPSAPTPVLSWESQVCPTTWATPPSFSPQPWGPYVVSPGAEICGELVGF